LKTIILSAVAAVVVAAAAVVVVVVVVVIIKFNYLFYVLHQELKLNNNNSVLYFNVLTLQHKKRV
jgi:hypothetical protein